MMWLQGVGTRRRPCASRLSSHDGAPWLQECLQALEEATTEKKEPPSHQEGNFSLKSLHSDGFIHFSAMTVLGWTGPCFR